MRFCVLLAALFLACPFFAFAREQPIPFYRIKALAPAQLSPMFVELNAPPFLTPKINDEGIITYNIPAGGFTLRQGEESIPIFIEDKRVFVHDINDKGKLLVSYPDPSGVIQYYLCDSDPWRRFSDAPLFLTQARQLYFNRLTNKNAAIGYKIVRDELRAAYYSNERGLFSLPCFHLLASSQENALVGVKNGRLAYYTLKRGEICMDDLSALTPAHCESYVSALLDGQGRVIGEVEKKGKSRFFLWNPEECSFCFLPFQRFIPKLINCNGLIIGKSCGKFAIATLFKKPIDLEKLILQNEKKPKTHKWHILQITDINSKGELVGVAIHRHKPYFVALFPCVRDGQ